VWSAQDEGEIMAHNSGRFHFDGNAFSFVRTAVCAALITFWTFGFGLPFALVLLERWRCRHTYVDGRRLTFSGTGLGLFAVGVKCILLCVMTFGIYSFWVIPRIQQWRTENTDFDPTWPSGALAALPQRSDGSGPG
jgi:uncharacterized membrane protein YjgN (DUF898 family)